MKRNSNVVLKRNRAKCNSVDTPFKIVTSIIRPFFFIRSHNSECNNISEKLRYQKKNKINFLKLLTFYLKVKFHFQLFTLVLINTKLKCYQ